MLNKLAKIILKYPKIILGLVFLITIYFGYTAFFSKKKLEVDFSLEQMFPENDKDRSYYEEYIDEFGIEENVILIVYSCDSLFSKIRFEENALVNEELEFIDGVKDVFSISNLPINILQNVDVPQTIWNEEVKQFENHPFYSKMFLSKNKNTSIILHLSDEVQSQKDRRVVLHEVEKTLNQTDWDWHIGGMPVMRTKYIDLVIHERMIFLPLAFLVVIAVLSFTFRQIKGVVIPLIAISTTLIWVAGIMAMFGISINVISYLTFNLLMIIGVADAIHLLIKYHEGLNKNLAKNQALKEVVNDIGGALFLTSFTTAIGFFSLIFTNIRITKEFGVTLGFGVILLFILTIVIMPVLLSLIDIPDKNHIKRLIVGGRLQTAEKLNKWNNLHPKSILSITGILFCLSIVGLNRMDYNASILDDLKPGNKIYDDIQFIENEYGGTFPFDIIIRNNDTPLEINEKLLINIETFSQYLMTIPEISTVVSIVDHLKLQNEVLYGEFKLPNEQDIQSYLLSRNSPFVSPKNNVKISAKISNLNTKRADIIKQNILKEASNIFDATFEIGVTSTTLLALKTNKHLVTNLTTSFFIAFVVIFISMTLLFRSFWLSLLSVTPIILPLFVAGGLMGYLGIKLRPSTAMTFSIALGITVDDTIHFLSRFRKEYLQSRNHKAATERTLLTTGKAILNTTIILGMGFFVLIFSEFVPNEEFGLLATIIIIVALIASIILLPVLINTLKPKFMFSKNT